MEEVMPEEGWRPDQAPTAPGRNPDEGITDDSPTRRAIRSHNHELKGIIELNVHEKRPIFLAKAFISHILH